MLDGWALTQSRLKKTVAVSLFERRHLQLASCVHALTAAEAEAIRRVEPRAEVIVVPNGIRLPDGPSEEGPEGPARRLLYLGRLHKKKGLEHLLKGWAEFRSSSPGTASDWRLEIAGWGDREYVAHLRQIGEQLALGDSVEWSGPLFGAQREAAYRRAQAVILPSVSEGLPMVLLEAWSYRLPTFMTPQCNLPEGFAAGAGIRIEAGADSIASALAMRLADTAGLRAAGEAGFRLVQQNYSWAEIAGRWKRIYDWTAGRGPRPAEVLVPSVLSAETGLS
jgi:poly(glycerol-phosphate) alpha-glucosyltransferase